jgi:ketosteroid isomerase-like protein
MVPLRRRPHAPLGDTPGVPWYDELIAAATESFERRDVAPLRPWMHPDVVFDWSRSRNDLRGVYHGIDTWDENFASFFEPWEEFHWEVTSVEPIAEDRLLAMTHVVGRGRGSGIEIEARGAQVWEHRDEKLTRVTMYQGRDDAVEAEKGPDVPG